MQGSLQDPEHKSGKGKEAWGQLYSSLGILEYVTGWGSLKASREFWAEHRRDQVGGSGGWARPQPLHPLPPTVSLSNIHSGNSLAVRWLGLCFLTAEGLGSIPGRGTKIPQAAQSGKRKRKKKRKKIKHPSPSSNLVPLPCFPSPDTPAWTVPVQPLFPPTSCLQILPAHFTQHRPQGP